MLQLQKRPSIDVPVVRELCSLTAPFFEDFPDDSAVAGRQQLVSITGPDLYAHAFLSGISHGSLRLTAAIPIGVGTPVEITIPACRGIHGVVMANKSKDDAFHIVVFFEPTLPLASFDIGELVSVTQLNPFAFLGAGIAMDRAGTLCSLACEQPPAMEAWIRLETESAVLFGEVVSVLPGGTKYATGIRLDAVLAKVSATEARSSATSTHLED